MTFWRIYFFLDPAKLSVVVYWSTLSDKPKPNTRSGSVRAGIRDLQEFGVLSPKKVAMAAGLAALNCDSGKFIIALLLKIFNISKLLKL